MGSALFRALRVHQYVKNLLVFLPLIFGHFIQDSHAIEQAVFACMSFCCLSSSAYIFNDLMDREKDQQHALKARRPFASGELSITTGRIMLTLLFLMALTLSFTLSWPFRITLLLYYVITFLYSLYLKKRVLLDVFCLATLYTLRVIAGVAAIGSLYSPWLLSFSLFMFLSLAFVKRCAELNRVYREQVPDLSGRGYLVEDLQQLQSFGTVSGYLAVLILALYIHSEVSIVLYKAPVFLWLICFMLLFWISRTWLLIARGRMPDDPILFALSDRVSWLCLGLSLLDMYLATWPF